MQGPLYVQRNLRHWAEVPLCILICLVHVVRWSSGLNTVESSLNSEVVQVLMWSEASCFIGTVHRYQSLSPQDHKQGKAKGQIYLKDVKAVEKVEQEYLQNKPNAFQVHLYITLNMLDSTSRYLSFVTCGNVTAVSGVSVAHYVHHVHLPQKNEKCKFLGNITFISSCNDVYQYIS